MKHVAVVLLALGLIASVVTAQEVPSANMVGFHKFTVGDGKLALVTAAFESLNGQPMKTSDVLGNNVPDGISVHWYNSAASTYVTDNKGFAGWGDVITFSGGMGFWIEVPVGTGNAEITLKGQVPMGSVKTNTVYQGITQLGFPYTASVLWTNTVLAKNAQDGDSLHVFDPVTRSYNTYNKGFAGWGDADTLVINLSQGFWFETTASQYFNAETRPYAKQ